MPAKRYIMALDAGTTSVRCILFDSSGRIASVAQREFTQYFPQDGWVEQDAEEIWLTQLAVAREAMEKLNCGSEDIAALGITNQRETVVVWNRQTGEPLCRAIVWQCRRTAEYCDRLRADGLEGFIRERTGLVIDPYFSGTKLRWILENVPGARELAERGELLFGTVDSWLIWKLSGGRLHITDYSNASRTMLYNIHTLRWDGDMLKLLGIPEAMLPEVRASSECYGYTEPSLFGGEIPICAAAGDQQSALFGQACFNAGDVKTTYGTGGFLLMNTGTTAAGSDNGLLTTIAWGEGGKVEYALEGSVFVAGAAIKWLRDEVRLIGSARECDVVSESVEDSGGVYLVPAFVGLGAPYWDPYARGVLTGLTRSSGRAQIVRATLDSLAYQTGDVISAMIESSGVTPSVIKADGGASVSDILLSFQADICRIPVERPVCVETSALGAAYLAGLACGFWSGRDDIVKNRGVDRVFVPQMPEERREKLLSGWHKAVKRSLGWANE